LLIFEYREIRFFFKCDKVEYPDVIEAGFAENVPPPT